MWDKAIAEVKQELARPAMEKREDGKTMEMQDVEAGEEEPMAFSYFEEGQEEEGFQYTDGQTKADWPANTGAPLQQRRLAPNSMYAEDWQRDNLAKRSWTLKKVAMMQTSMDILLLEMIRELQLRDESYLASESISADFRPAFHQEAEDIASRLDERHDRLRILRRAHFDMTHYTLPDAPEKEFPIPPDENSMCNYAEDGEGHSRAMQRELNESLRRLFSLHSRQKINRPTMYGHILYSLSTSPAPPNMDTFNNLLLGFSAAEDPIITNVIRSFRRCHMRPNEMTLATVLNHMAKSDNLDGFRYWIELIRGRNNGLALARPDVAITEASRARLIHHPEHPERIIQLPYHTPVVFGAIIAGVLKFTGFEAALQICQSMGQEGWGLCMAGLTPLLHDCVQRSDWDSGMTVWKQILALKEKSRRQLDSQWVSERIRLDTFATMLKLCSRCNRRDYFDGVWQMAIKSHRDATKKLEEMLKGRKKKVIEDAVDRSIARSMNGKTDVESLRKGEVNYWEFAERSELSGMSEHEVQDPRMPAPEPAAAATEQVLATREEQTSDSKEASSAESHQQSEPSALPLHAQSESKSSETKLALAKMERRKQHRLPQIKQEELHGLVPSGDELNEYEARERPMSLRA